MRVFQMVMAVLFCAALTFYLWVAVPRVQAQDTSMPVLTDETDGELALSVTAPESGRLRSIVPNPIGKRSSCYCLFSMSR